MPPIFRWRGKNTKQTRLIYKKEMRDRPKKKDEILGEELRPHVYDGIQEFDNRLPNWWLWTLYGAMIFSVIYWLSWISTGVVPPDEERLANAMSEIESRRLAAAGNINNDTLWQMAGNETFIQQGEEVYNTYCASCHLASLNGDEEGGIGESLANESWLYDNSAMYVYNMINEGSPNTKAGMVAWGPTLGPAKVSQVTAYVLSYHSPDSMANATVEMPDGP